MLKVTTESGTIYEIDLEKMRLRRRNKDAKLRKDGTWLKMLVKPDIKLNQRLVIALEPLGAGDVTSRFSTPVVKIEEITK